MSDLRFGAEPSHNVTEKDLYNIGRVYSILTPVYRMDFYCNRPILLSIAIVKYADEWFDW